MRAISNIYICIYFNIYIHLYTNIHVYVYTQGEVETTLLSIEFEFDYRTNSFRERHENSETGYRFEVDYIFPGFGYTVFAIQCNKKSKNHV